MKYFYGPVPSRRLGLSLGVDLTPRKVCSFDCIYCQIGRTSNKTLRRKWYIDLPRFKRELSRILKSEPGIDYITISGSGEPTLHKGLDKIIKTIKKVTKNKYPVCVITNSSLLYRESVRKELLDADLIIPSLDAPDTAGFKKINRPVEGITLSNIIKGLVGLRREFKGKIWLEIMLINGVNDSPAQAREFKKIIEKISPGRVQLNLPVRPSIMKAKPPAKNRIKKFREIIGKDTETVSPLTASRQSSLNRETRKPVIRFLSRRPATIDDLSAGLGCNRNLLSKILAILLEQGVLKSTKHSNKLFYELKERKKK